MTSQVNGVPREQRASRFVLFVLFHAGYDLLTIIPVIVSTQ